MQKIQLDGCEYSVDNLSENGQKLLALLKFANEKTLELERTRALLRKAKASYMNELQKELLSAKAGFFLEDE